MIPDLLTEPGEAALFALLCPPIFKNRLSSDIDSCLLEIVAELSSFKCDRWSFWPPPKIWECLLFSPLFTSTWLHDDRGRDTEDELVVARCFEFNAVNLNLGSIESRFLD